MTPKKEKFGLRTSPLRIPAHTNGFYLVSYKLETASLMKREAFDINMIEKMTGLSKKEIENL